jgi:transcriptional regulator with XRE-family HTH domain
MGNTVSIKDLARKFKCAPSTISRALNDHPMINIDTRKTIQEYARISLPAFLFYSLFSFHFSLQAFFYK